MSYYDGLVPAYTFRLSIEREDRTIIASSITVKGSKDEIAKAKKTMNRLLNEYTPEFKTPAPAPLQPEPEPEQPAQDEPPEMIADTDTDTAADQQQAQNELPPPETKTRKDEPEGIFGPVHLHCAGCGSIFGTFLKQQQTFVRCKCGNHIDLVDPPLARFEMDCPYCGKHTYGRTNLEDATVTVRCKCGENLELWWDRENKEYSN